MHVVFVSDDDDDLKRKLLFIYKDVISVQQMALFHTQLEQRVCKVRNLINVL